MAWGGTRGGCACNIPFAAHKALASWNGRHRSGLALWGLGVFARDGFWIHTGVCDKGMRSNRTGCQGDIMI